MQLIDICGELFNADKIMKVSKIYKQSNASDDMKFRFDIEFYEKIRETFSFFSLASAVIQREKISFDCFWGLTERVGSVEGAIREMQDIIDPLIAHMKKTRKDDESSKKIPGTDECRSYDA